MVINLNESALKVENVVVFVTLGNRIPLDKISKDLKDAEYAPESFPGARPLLISVYRYPSV
jgi:TATA-box binding protein (TBP) (component of TFIID and TFIIIB)